MFENVGAVDCVSDDGTLPVLHVGQVDLSQTHIRGVDQTTLFVRDARDIANFGVLDFIASAVNGDSEITEMDDETNGEI